jgi:hypothetical protein
VPVAPLGSWQCKARRSADPPQDCNWPHCGCDPNATKVLEALYEEGYLSPSEVRAAYGEAEGVEQLRSALSGLRDERDAFQRDELREEGSTWKPLMEAADAAIAKAEGR